MNPAPSHPPARPGGALRSVLAALPSVLVLAGLGAIGVFGHAHGWKAPAFAEVFGATAADAGPATAADAGPAAADDPTGADDAWCATHGAPEAECIACHPELMGGTRKGWCSEHGVPEKNCTLCHPALLLTGVPDEWCAEHGLPVAGCTLCNPGLAVLREAPTDATSPLVSPGEHGRERPEDHPLGAPEGAGHEGAAPEGAGHEHATPTPAGLRDSRTCQKHALKVQFASVAALHKCGVQLAAVVQRPMLDSLVVNSEADYDRSRYARIGTRVEGSVLRVEHDLGDALKAGDPLVLIASAEVGAARTAFLAAQAALVGARRTAERMASSGASGVRTEVELLEAEAMLRAAELRLLETRQALAALGLPAPPEDIAPDALAVLGLPPALIERLAVDQPGTAELGNLLTLVAPFDGLVVARDVVLGENVGPERVLFELADTRRMAIAMDVPQEDAHRLALGAEVLFRPDDARDEVVAGRLTWISSAVDDLTRTVQVRAEVENPAASLRAHAFGHAQIVVRSSPLAVAVPTEAVQWEGCCYIVFVQLTDTVFQTRKVRLGARDSHYTEVVGGVLPGEVVATAGSHVLKSKILESSLGAGCVDD